MLVTSLAISHLDVVDYQEARGNAIGIKAMCHLSEMFGYATALRSNSQGRATFVMQLATMKEAPKSITEEIVKKRNAWYLQ